MDLNKKSLRGLQREAVQRQSGTVDTSVLVDLDRIIVDEAIQVRQNGLDLDRVEQYALAMIEYGGYGKFPPLVVFRDPATNDLYLAGGFHRCAAVGQARQGLIQDGKPPIEQVPCEVRTGNRQAAIEFAEDDNLQHGLNLTNRDKQAIYARRMTEGHIWAEYSNRRIAAELGVGEATIRRWRNDLAPAPNDAGESTTRIGADGKTYDVSGIQAANQQRSVEQNQADQTDPSLQPHPPSTSTRLSGVSHETPAEPVGRFEDDQAVGEQIPVLAALQDFIGLAVNVAKHLEDIRDGRVPINTDLETGLYDLVVDAFDYLNGYENPRGKWIVGLVDLLETVREQMER